MRDQRPKVLIRADCYHFEQRMYRSGKHTSVRKEPIVSYPAREEFLYKKWMDISQSDDAVDFAFSSRVTRVYFDTTVQCSTNVLQRFINQRNNFRSRMFFDRNRNFFEETVLTGERKSVLAINDECCGSPWYTNRCLYILLLILQLGWI